jgi:hypothetical protein
MGFAQEDTYMAKHNLAVKQAEKPQAEAPEPQKWVQEEEKLKNQQYEVEPIQEKIQRLHVGFDLRRLYL